MRAATENESHDAAPPTTDDRPTTWRIAACGFAMGAADIVPGVSGGTVALVLGIYERLLAAISGFDGELLKRLLRGDLRSAARRVDFLFLALLGLGIATGVVGLAGLMSYLLTEHRELTFSAFFGLILASGVLVGRMVRPGGTGPLAGCVALGAAGAAVAFAIVTIAPIAAPAGLLYTFACGAIAICAMILPGVSGAYLLLILGKYEEVTGILKRLPKLDVTASDVATVGVFCAGCALGLLMFSKLLRWLLARFHAPTMAVLCGFMIGSLYRVWPFQLDTTPEVEEFKHKILQPQLPPGWSAHVGACLSVAVFSFVAVLAVEAIAKKRPAPSDS